MHIINTVSGLNQMEHNLIVELMYHQNDYIKERRKECFDGIIQEYKYCSKFFKGNSMFWCR